MKKLFIVVLITLGIVQVNAQDSDASEGNEAAHASEASEVVEETEITTYAEILGWNTNILGLGKGARVEIEFGEESWGWKGNDGRNLIVDENGKAIKFNSMVDAMNFMGERGWKFEAAYVATVANQNVIHWLMSKKIKHGDNVRDGILQKRDFKKTKEGKKKNYEDPIYGDTN